MLLPLACRRREENIDETRTWEAIFMSTDPQLLRAEPFTEIGLIIQRDAGIILQRWTCRAVEEQPTARRVHHQALLDHFREFLQAMGRSLMETDEARTSGHCHPATVHGEQRWEVGWSLPELIRDYQILRLVILEYLEETLERSLASREVMAIGLALDEAISASIVTYATSRDEHLRQLEEKRAELNQQIQEHLRQHTFALQESDRRKNEFLATLAHELRNPLAPLRNALEVLFVQPPTDPTVLQIRDIFDRQVRQMTRLLDDLLDVSRIAQGKVVLRKERVNLATVAAQAAQMSEPLLKSRRLQFELIPPREELWLEADPARLVQIIVNLLNNAAKYTDRGGRVWLVVEREEGEAVVRVRDTGTGITPELLPHIFNLFTQAEWPADRAQGGLGIGLSLVRRLVELHDGAIVAESAGPNRGSEFIVRLPALPVAATANPSLAVSAPSGAFPSPPRRILVVDDNLDAAESLALLLRLQGHDVHVAYDGAAALTAAETLAPEAAILDIGLPHMDGYQVAQRMREKATGRRLLLVALTGYGQDEDRQRSLKAGFNAHLVKPVDLEALNRILARGVPAN